MTQWLYDFLIRRPIQALSVLACLGFILIVIQFSSISENIRYSTALKSAEAYSSAMATIRNFYSSEIVPRARKGGATVTHNYADVPGAIPLPATLSIELGELVSRTSTGGRFRFYSRFPFPWRTHGGPRDAFESDALEALSSGKRKDFVRVEVINGEPVLRYAAPVRMGESCVACHNSTPNSPKTDWKVGDVRGVQSVQVPLPKLSIGDTFQQFGLYVFMVLGGVTGLWLFAFLLRRLNRVVVQERRLLDASKMRNEELQVAKTAAEQANHSKSEFLANISHELRTPLNAINGFSEAMLSQVHGPMQNTHYEEYVRDIRESGGQLLDLINILLDLSKIEAGKYELYEEEVDMHAVISAAMRLVRGQARATNIRLQTRLTADLPYLYADERAMRQIVLNLLANAVKFTSEGGKVLVLADIDTDGSFLLGVADTGIGIAEADISRVMLPFERANASHIRKTEGAGLGLPLVASLVRLHGGIIKIESTVGEGTTVLIRFPAERVLTQRAAESRTAEIGAGLPPQNTESRSVENVG
jgi:signal transduction histidine kinase